MSVASALKLRFAHGRLAAGFGLLLAAAPAVATPCSEDLRRIDAAIKAQYGGTGAWWEWFACPVCLNSELKKGALVTKEQIREISRIRNLAISLERKSEEKMCKKMLDAPKKMLKVF